MTTTIDYVNWKWISYLFLGVTVSPSTKQWLCIFMFTMTGSVEPLLLCHSLSLLLLLLSFFSQSFLTRLSSPPSFSVRSDCPAFLAFQLRMLEIPSSCCGLAKSLLLFHPSSPHPVPMHPTVYIWSAPDKDRRGFFVGITFTPRLTAVFLLSVSALSKTGSQTEPHDSQRGGLETGFYTRGNGVKGDSTPSKAQKNELIRYWGRAFSATAWRISKRKDTLGLNRQDVRVTEKWLRWSVNRRVWMNRVHCHEEWLTF